MATLVSNFTKKESSIIIDIFRNEVDTDAIDFQKRSSLKETLIANKSLYSSATLGILKKLLEKQKVYLNLLQEALTKNKVDFEIKTSNIYSDIQYIFIKPARKKTRLENLSESVFLRLGFKLVFEPLINVILGADALTLTTTYIFDEPQIILPDSAALDPDVINAVVLHETTHAAKRKSTLPKEVQQSQIAGLSVTGENIYSLKIWDHGTIEPIESDYLDEFPMDEMDANLKELFIKYSRTHPKTLSKEIKEQFYNIYAMSYRVYRIATDFLEAVKKDEFKIKVEPDGEEHQISISAKLTMGNKPYNAAFDFEQLKNGVSDIEQARDVLQKIQSKSLSFGRQLESFVKKAHPSTFEEISKGKIYWCKVIPNCLASELYTKSCLPLFFGN